MNAFRLLFLIAVITAASLLALTKRAPAVYLETVRNGLQYQAESDSRVLARVEEAAANSRLELASWLAASPVLVDAWRPVEPPADGAVAPQRGSSAGPEFNGLLADTYERMPTSIDAVALFATDGSVIAPQTDRGIVRVAEFGVPAGVASVVETGEPVHAAFVRAGRLFMSAAAPVRTSTGVTAVVVVVEEYDGATIAERRGEAGVQAMYFVNRDVLGGAVGAPEYEAEVEEVLSRTTDASVGEAGRFRNHAFRTVDVVVGGPDSEAPAAEHLIFLGPIRFDVASGDTVVGAVIVTDAQQPPATLWRILVQNRAFDDGAMEVWTYLAMGLALFFAGLFLHDWSMGRSVRLLSERIEVSVTSTDPAPLALRSFPQFLRPIAASFNEFLEQFREQSDARRRAEDHAEQTRTLYSEPERDRILSSADYPEIDAARVEPVSFDAPPGEPVLTRPPTDEEPVRTDFDHDGDSVNRVAADFLAAHAPTPMGGVGKASAGNTHADTRPAFEAPIHTDSDSQLARRLAEGDRLEEFDEFEEPDTQNTIPTLSDLPDLEEIGDSFDHMHGLTDRDRMLHGEGTGEFNAVEEDPHQSGTVPRATVDELAREAAVARSRVSTPSADEEAVLSRAEARLRSLGAEPVSASREAADPRRVLYEEFVAARVATGDGAEGLTWEKFSAKLEKNRRVVMQKFGCSDVRFRVDVSNGKAALKATPVK